LQNRHYIKFGNWINVADNNTEKINLLWI